MPAKIKKASVKKITNPSKYIFDFSNWETMSGKEFHSLKHTAIAFYRNNLKNSELQEDVYRWMKERKYKKADIDAVKNGDINSSIGLLCRLMNSNCPDMNKKESVYWDELPGTTGQLKPLTDYILPAIDEAKERGKKVIAAEKKTKANDNTRVISIQERMQMQVDPLLIEIEGFLDDWLNGDAKMSEFHCYNKLVSYQPTIKPAHAKIIADRYQRMFNEAREVGEFKDPDIKEHYSHLKPKQRKEFAKFFVDLEDACNMISAKTQKTRKPRKKKAVDETKLVAKLKYKKVDSDYGVASISPVDIISAKELWVFNTKYRKLTRFVADEYEKTLSVKGTTIQGFDKGKSETKTLRKPEEQLKEFMKAGKVALRKFMDNITTKGSVPNGRMNDETILLKAVK